MTEYVYVTGCDTGFGNIVAKMLDKKGLGVFAGCFLKDSIDQLQSECSSKMRAVQLDVASEESVENVATYIRDTLASEPGSKLVGVVNNAGIMVAAGPVEWTPLESYKRMFNVNVLGTVMVTKSVLPLIRKSRGRIVNVSSCAGRMGLPSQPAYCISKYGIEAYTDVLRRDMLPWDVSVILIVPGVFNKTGLYNNFQTGLDKLWKDLPDDLKKDYGDSFYQFYRKKIGMALYDLGNTNSNLVPEAMVQALTSKNPKYRYRVGFDSKYIITLLEKMPEVVQDDVLTATDFRLPAVPPAGAPKNGVSTCRARYTGSHVKYWLAFFALIYLYRKYRK